MPHHYYDSRQSSKDIVKNGEVITNNQLCQKLDILQLLLECRWIGVEMLLEIGDFDLVHVVQSVLSSSVEMKMRTGRGLLKTVEKMQPIRLYPFTHRHFEYEELNVLIHAIQVKHVCVRAP